MDEMKAAEKTKKLKDEYDLVLTPDTEKELTEMGSLAEGIAERARQEEKNLTIVNSIHNLMETLHLTAEQAMNALKIPATEQGIYRANLTT